MFVLTLGEMLRRQFSHDTEWISRDPDSQSFDRRYVCYYIKVSSTYVTSTFKDGIIIVIVIFVSLMNNLSNP